MLIQQFKRYIFLSYRRVIGPRDLKMIGQKNLRSFHSFLDFPVSWIQEKEKEPRKLANDKKWQWETKPTGYVENERTQHSEGTKRKLHLGIAHKRVRGLGAAVQTGGKSLIF